MRIGPWWIRPYTLKVTLGVLVALVVLWRRAPRIGIDRRRLPKWTWIFAVAAVLGGRAGYVIGNAAYFAKQPDTIFRLDQVGGLHSGSAMVCGLLVVWIWAKTTSVNVRTVLDFLAPAMLCITASAWWGCVGVGCAWGQVVFAASGWQRWFIAELPDIYHVIEPRYAVQIIGAILSLLLVLLACMRREWGSVALGVYLLGTAGLTFLRADPVPKFGALRSDFILDLALAGVVFATIVLDVRRTSIMKLARS